MCHVRALAGMGKLDLATLMVGGMLIFRVSGLIPAGPLPSLTLPSLSHVILTLIVLSDRVCNQYLTLPTTVL